MKVLIAFVSLIVLLQPHTTVADDISAQEPITPENAENLVQVARYGDGVFTDALAWSPDSSRLAFGGSLGVWIYNVTDASKEPDFIDYDRWVYALAWSPDGETLAITQNDGVHIYDLIAKEDRMVVSGTGAAAFSPDGKLLGVGGKVPASDEESEWRSVAGLHIYDAETGNLITTYRTTYQESNVVRLQFGVDNTTLAAIYSVDGNAASCYGEEFQYLDVYTVENLIASTEPAPILATEVVNKGMGWNGLSDTPITTGNRLLDGNGERIALYDLADGIKQATVGEIENWVVEDLALGKDGQFLMTTGLDPRSYPSEYTAIAFDLQTGEALFTLPQKSLTRLLFSPDGMWLAGFNDDSWIVWTVNGRELTLQNTFNLVPANWSVVDGRLQFSDQDILLATDQTKHSRSDDAVIWLSPSETWKATEVLNETTFTLTHTDSAKSLIIYENQELGARQFIGEVYFSSDNRWMAFDVTGWCGCGCGGYNTVYVWELDNSIEYATLSREFSTADVSQLSFSADNLLLAATYNDIRIWDILTGEQVAVLDRHTYDRVATKRSYIQNVYNAAFSQDHTQLFSYGGDGTIRVWAVDENRDSG